MNAPALRLFVALELPDSVRGELVRWRSSVVGGLDGLREVGSEGLHVTLCFLGSVAATEVPGVLEAFSVVGELPAVSLTVQSALWLPPRRPRVLAVSLADAGGRLGSVQATLSRSLSAGGWYRPEARLFLPHVTVARVRHGARAVSLGAPPAVAFDGRRVTLFRSRLGGGGARYEALGSVSLAGNGGGGGPGGP